MSDAKEGVGATDHRVEWYRDLIDGQGAALGMDAGVRAALRSVTEGTADEIAEGLRLQEEAARAAAERAETERRAAEAAEQRAEATRLRLQEEARVASERAAREQREAAERARRERQEAAEVAERERQEAAEVAERERKEAADRARQARIEAAERDETERRAARSAALRRRIARALGVLAYTVGTLGVLLYFQRTAIETQNGFAVFVGFVGPLPFGIFGGLIAKKLFDPGDRHDGWPYVVLGVFMWIGAAALAIWQAFW